MIYNVELFPMYHLPTNWQGLWVGLANQAFDY